MLQDELRLGDLAGQVGWPERVVSLEARIERFNRFPIIGERPVRTKMRRAPEEPL